MEKLIVMINKSLGGKKVAKRYCNECGLTRKTFNLAYEKLPVFPYFASVYNTLVSIVCGVSIGYLFSAGTWTTLAKSFNKSIWLGMSCTIQIVIIFAVIASIWHHYIINTQFVSWKIDKIDSIIPFFFAGLISFGIYIINNDNGSHEYYFFVIFVPLFYLSASIAYINSYIKLNKNNEFNYIESLDDSSLSILFKCLNKSIQYNHLVLIKFFMIASIFFYTLSYLLKVSLLISNIFIQNIYLSIILFTLYVSSKLCFDPKFCKSFRH